MLGTRIGLHNMRHRKCNLRPRNRTANVSLRSQNFQHDLPQQIEIQDNSIGSGHLHHRATAAFSSVMHARSGIGAASDNLSRCHFAFGQFALLATRGQGGCFSRC